MSPWITVVGLGEDGMESLAPAARAAVEAADVLAGGERHLAKVPGTGAERITWGGGFPEALDKIAERRGQRVVVLASGDPMNFGVGAMLGERFGADAVCVLPAPGAFSLAAARLCWPLADTETLTVHGRPIEAIALYFAPGARLLILSADGGSPGLIAALLAGHGFGPSPMTVFENMGGANEARLDGNAGDWPHARGADLNTVAVECRAGDGVVAWSRAPGLPEDAFEHDGQITKREVRAATIAALAPLPGQVLWDVGAGSGAVAIEWLRMGASMRAVAVEHHPGRCAAIVRNAATLGVPGLRLVEGTAPEVLAGLEPRPDAVFAGGGVSRDGVLEACWEALKPGGRLVANAATIEAERRLYDFQQSHAGTLVRISVQRLEDIGGFHALRPLMPVTQYAGAKS
jgi:precorrin-6Y C5,15-methyltransferase (decarboxylating)